MSMALYTLKYRLNQGGSGKSRYIQTDLLAAPDATCQGLFNTFDQGNEMRLQQGLKARY